MSEYLTIVPGEIPTRELHGFLLGSVSPRPICFASTLSADGIPNLAPYSFFNIFGSNPPIAIFSPARRVRDNTTKDTLSNIVERPEVVINVVSHAIVQQMNLASSEYDSGINEFEKAGFTALPSDLVAPFRVGESPVQLECKVVEIKPLGTHGGAGNLIFSRVVKMHIHKDVLNEAGRIDPHKIDLVGRMGGDFYVRASGESVFEVEKPLAQPGMGIDALPEPIRLSKVLRGNDLGMLGNMPGLPAHEELASFYETEKGGRLSGVTDHEALHELARELLALGQKEDALKVLLCDRFLG